MYAFIPLTKYPQKTQSRAAVIQIPFSIIKIPVLQLYLIFKKQTEIAEGCDKVIAKREIMGGIEALLEIGCVGGGYGFCC